MDVFELIRRFKELEDKIAELQKYVANLDNNKADKVHYPQYNPVEWPQTPKWTQPSTYPHSFPNIICSTGEKV